ncbi:MAG TPA: hypothetical protein VF735_05140 [Pyrinomonadaceae bacterium]
MNFSQTFFENIVLLILTTLLVSFGVPYVFKIIDERKLRERKEVEEIKLREQKRFEAELARQGKIIEAQSKFLDDLSQLLWKWRYMAKKLAHYGAAEYEERYEIAKKEYDENVWDLLHQIRIEISRSRRLVSEQAYNNLSELYDYIAEIDEEIYDLIKKGMLNKEVAEMAYALSDRVTSEATEMIDSSIDSLASELKLKVKA